VDREPALAAPDLQPARSALLESFLRYYERAADQPGGELETRIESARTRHRIGRIYERMGLFEVASWQYAESLAAFEDLEKDTPGQRFPEERAELLGTLGELLRSQPARRGEARAQLEQAMDLLKDAATPKAPLPRRRLLARVLGSLAELEQAEEHPEQAADAWQQAVAIHEAIVSGSSATNEDRAALASSLIGLGRVLATVPATTAPGLAAMARGVELRQAVVRAGPSMPDQAHELARNLSDLAHLHQTLGETGLAVDHARRAVEVYEQLDRRFPDTVAYQMGLYLAYDRLSRLLGMRNETKLALERSIQARGVLERLVSGHPKDKIFVLDLARCHSLIGRLHQRRRAYLDALASFQKAVDLLESVAGLDGESSYQLAVNLSLCVSLLGASDEAPPPDDEATLNTAERLRRQVYGKRAVVALEQAFSKGLANPEPYRSDPDLDPLRDRPDFQTLLQKIDDKTKARNAEAR
jgi:tetratricopeptide (TPR) repeat protein